MRPPRREGRTDPKNSAFKRAMLRAVEAQVAKEGEDPVARLSASFAALDTEQSGQVKTRDLVWLLEELGSAGPGAEGGGGGGEGAEGAEEGEEAGERVLRAAFAGKEAVDLDEFLTAALDWPALKQDEHWYDWARAAFVNITGGEERAMDTEAVAQMVCTDVWDSLDNPEAVCDAAVADVLEQVDSGRTGKITLGAWLAALELSASSRRLAAELPEAPEVPPAA